MTEKRTDDTGGAGKLEVDKQQTETQKLTVAEFIKEARELLGMGRLEFAETLGVTRRSVAYWEAGEKTPNEPTLRWIGVLLSSKGYSLAPPV